jgi:glycosyltransferase 2 family protein
MNRKLLVALVLIAVVGIVAYASRGWKFDWRLFVSSFRTLHVGWLVASIVATLATYLVRAIRWQVLLNPLKRIHLHGLLTATLVGFSAIYVLGRAGELVRPVWLTRKEHVPFSASLATILVERVLDFLMLVLLFAWTLMVVEIPQAAHASGPMELMKKMAWVLVVSSTVLMIGMFVFRSNIDRIVGFIPFQRIGKLMHNFAQGLSFLQGGRGFAVVLFHSVILWLLIALQFWFMLLGMQMNFSFAAASLVMVGAAIGSIAQIPGVGGGFQAGLIFCLGTLFAVPAEKSAAVSLIAWVLSVAPTIGIAAVYMLATGLSLKDIVADSKSEMSILRSSSQ